MKKKGWRFEGNEIKYIEQVLDSDFKNPGSKSMTQKFERLFAKTFGVSYAISSTSGTAALHQALIACDIRPGDEVIVPSLAVVMCANAVVFCGAKPVFADIDRETFLIDPADIERKITPRTKAIMAVHMCGHMCDMEKITTIARKCNLRVIEDCAQCNLAVDHRGYIAGTLGDVGTFSLGEVKMISSGEGGVLITNNIEIAERVRKFGYLGFKYVSPTSVAAVGSAMRLQDPVYTRHDSTGYNYIMSEITAAVALAQTERINWFLEKRRAMGRMYTDAIDKCNWLRPQHTQDGYNPSYWTFAAIFEGQNKVGISWYEFRDKFIEFGGDKIRAALALVYKDPSVFNLDRTGCYFPDRYRKDRQVEPFLPDDPACPNSEYIQPRLMYFTTNQETKKEMVKQAEALRKTVRHFG